MSSEKIQIFLKNKNWWFDDVAGEYLSVLDQMGVERDSEFGEFYLHAPDGHPKLPHLWPVKLLQAGQGGL